MILTKEKLAEFEAAARPLVKFLAENCHPYCTAVVGQERAELHESIGSVPIPEYVEQAEIVKPGQ